MFTQLKVADQWQHVGVVLAAGAGRRFGSPKAPVVFDNERLVDRAVRVLREGGCPDVVVVLGAWVGSVADAQVIVNPQWASGMGSSLRAALAYLLQHPRNPLHQAVPRRAVITLVDLPGLKAEAVTHLCSYPGTLLAASYGNQQGHPVLIGEQHWPELIAELSGDCGAKEFLRRHGACLVELSHLASGTDLDHPI